MVTSPMVAVDEGIPNFEELPSKTEAVFFALLARRMNSANYLKKGFSNYQSVTCHSN